MHGSRYYCQGGRVAAFAKAISVARLWKSEYDQEIPQSHTADQPTAP